MTAVREPEPMTPFSLLLLLLRLNEIEGESIRKKLSAVNDALDELRRLVPDAFDIAEVERADMDHARTVPDASKDQVEFDETVTYSDGSTVDVRVQYPDSEGDEESIDAYRLRASDSLPVYPEMGSAIPSWEYDLLLKRAKEMAHEDGLLDWDEETHSRLYP